MAKNIRSQAIAAENVIATATFHVAEWMASKPVDQFVLALAFATKPDSVCIVADPVADERKLGAFKVRDLRRWFCSTVHLQRGVLFEERHRIAFVGVLGTTDVMGTLKDTVNWLRFKVVVLVVVFVLSRYNIVQILYIMICILYVNL